MNRSTCASGARSRASPTIGGGTYFTTKIIAGTTAAARD
jgi:hypothetical protein